MPVAPEQFGRDHWSTLAYLGHVVHKSGGEPDRNKMRCKPGNPRMGHIMAMVATGEDKYPTKLQGGAELFDHDDYDCADDLIAAGLMRNEGTGFFPVYDLTPPGLKLWSWLVRNYKSAGAMKAVEWHAALARAELTIGENGQLK